MRYIDWCGLVAIEKPVIVFATEHKLLMHKCRQGWIHCCRLPPHRLRFDRRNHLKRACSVMDKPAKTLRMRE